MAAILIRLVGEPALRALAAATGQLHCTERVGRSHMGPSQPQYPRLPPLPPWQFSNMKALLKSVTLNNIPMQRTNYGCVTSGSHCFSSSHCLLTATKMPRHCDAPWRREHEAPLPRLLLALSSSLTASLVHRYWVIDTPGKNIDLRPPYTLVLLSAQNQRLATRLESLKPQTLDVQFG